MRIGILVLQNSSYNQLTNIATATIGDGAIINASQDIIVDSNTNNLLIDLTAAGEAAEGWIGLTGAGVLNVVNNTNLAVIGDNVIISTLGDVLVDAQTDLNVISYVGSMTQGANLGIGMSGTVDVISNRTESLIGEATGEPVFVSLADSSSDAILTRDDGVSWTDDGFEEGQWIRVSNRENSGDDGLYRINTISGVNGVTLELVAGPSTPSRLDPALGVAVERIGRIEAAGVAGAGADKGQSGYSVAGAGSGAINVASTTVEASIAKGSGGADASVTSNQGTVNLTALDNTVIVALSGALGVSAAIGTDKARKRCDWSGCRNQCRRQHSQSDDFRRLGHGQRRSGRSSRIRITRRDIERPRLCADRRRLRRRSSREVPVWFRVGRRGRRFRKRSR